MHILAIGQSNLANHCGSHSSSPFGEVLLGGEVHPMADPIPGGSGDLGSVWPHVADKLRGRPGIDTLRLSLLAQGGTSIAEWAPGGKCFEIFKERHGAGDLAGVTHVVFQQGEKDTLLETGHAEYKKTFLSLHDAVTSSLGSLPWIICRSSYRFGVTSSNVISAQTDVCQSVAGAVCGPDLDCLGEAYRRDNTHFNAAGIEAFADDLARLLAARP